MGVPERLTLHVRVLPGEKGREAVFRPIPDQETQLRLRSLKAARVNRKNRAVAGGTAFIGWGYRVHTFDRTPRHSEGGHTGAHAVMAAARVTDEVLNMFLKMLGSRGHNFPQGLPPELVPNYDLFRISQNDFQDWLCVWRMDISDRNEGNKDLFQFGDRTRPKIADLLASEIKRLGSVKTSIGLEVKFKRESQNENGQMEEEIQRHYFKDNPHVLTRRNEEEQIDQMFEDFIDRVQGEIENS